MDTHIMCKYHKEKKAVIFCPQENAPLCNKCGVQKNAEGKELLDCEGLCCHMQNILDTKLKEEGGSEKGGVVNSTIQKFKDLREMVIKKMEKPMDEKEKIDKFLEEFRKKVENLEANGKGLIAEMQEYDKGNFTNTQEREKLLVTLKEDLTNHKACCGRDMLQLMSKKYENYKEDPIELPESLLTLADRVDNFKKKADFKGFFDKVLGKSLFLTKKKISAQAFPNYAYAIQILNNNICLYNIDEKKSKKVVMHTQDGKKFRPYPGSDNVLADGLLFIVGGSVEDNKVTGNTYEYSFMTEKLQLLCDLIIPRKDHTIEYIDNYIYCIGGKVPFEPTLECERLRVFDREDKAKWEKIPALSVARTGAAICSLFEKGIPVIYSVGGYGSSGNVNKVERLNCIKLEEWESIEINSWEKWAGRYGSGCFYDVDQNDNTNIIIFGGDHGSYIKNAYIINLSEKTLSEYKPASLEHGRSFFQRRVFYSRDKKEVYVEGDFEMMYFSKTLKEWKTISKEEWSPY